MTTTPRATLLPDFRYRYASCKRVIKIVVNKLQYSKNEAINIFKFYLIFNIKFNLQIKFVENIPEEAE